jgi:predicted AlkP superfamily pyrophosphatase or phosphodiesterase
MDHYLDYTPHSHRITDWGLCKVRFSSGGADPLILTVFLDGLRPDQVTTQHTPNILGLMKKGVRFLNHHAVFPTETRVNVASYVTGRSPGSHGIVGNTFIAHNNGAPWEVNTGQRWSLAKLEKETGGRLLQAKSLGEILSENGEKMVAISIGSEGNAYLNNHKAEKNGGLVIHPDFTIPEKEEEEMEHIVGAWPPSGTPNTERMRHATSILLDYVIPKIDPKVVTLWFSEPDNAQHKIGISSHQALQGIEHADAEIGRIVKHLKDRGVYDSTDLLVASDHGHSTVSQTVDVADQLVRAGLKEKNDYTGLQVSATGGCALVYVRNHEESKIQSVAEYLMAQEWCGSLFSNAAIMGALPMSTTRDQTGRSPDIMFSFQWSDEVNGQGIRGTAAFARGDVPVGAGSHGSISPYDIRNLLVAAGPSFKKGISSQTPSGIMDLTPTIIHVLGISTRDVFDGRVLSEAMVGGPDPKDVPGEAFTNRASRKVGGRTYEQELHTSRADSAEYLDWGRAHRIG